MRLPTGRLARSTLSTAVILGGRMVAQAFILLIMVRLFEPALFGRLAAASTLAALMGLLPMLGAGFVLMSRAPRDPDAAPHVWRYAWPLTLVLGTLLLIAYVPLAVFASGRDALPLLVLATLGATELLAMPLIALASFALQSRDRVPLSQALQTLPFALRVLALLPCFLIVGPARLQAYVFVQFSTTVVALFIALAIARRHFPMGGAPRRPTRDELADGAVYAGMQLASGNVTEIDKVMAVRLIGAHDTGLYAVASRVLIALMMPINAMLLAAQPRLFGIAHEPTREGHLLIRRVAALSGAWGLAVATLLMVGSLLAPYVFGEDYAITSRIMFWMAFVAPLMALRFAVGCVLVAIGRPSDRFVFEVTGILVVVVAILTLAPGFGTLGIVAAVGSGEIAMLALGTNLVLKRLAAHGLENAPTQGN